MSEFLQEHEGKRLVLSKVFRKYFDLNNSVPLFYEEYPGSINDVSQLQIMLEKAKGYGYKCVGFILDRGYFSKENIRYMDKCGYQFIIMMKGMKDSGLFLDLTAYTIITENNAGQYYPDYAYNHPLFTNKMKVYSDSKISSFIHNIKSHK